MRWSLKGATLVLSATLAVWLGIQARTVGQQARMLTVAPLTVDALRQWDSTVDGMVRAGDLTVRRRQDDTLLPGRTHERMDQMHQGVRIFGGDLTRQLQGGQTVSIFGVLYQNLSVDVTARLDTGQGPAAIQRLAGTVLGRGKSAELVVLPMATGRYVLTYTAELWTDKGPIVYFVDANSGAEVWRYNNLQTQSAVRSGKGVLGDDKKVSMMPLAGTYVADDQLRPPALRTFNMKEDLNRTIRFLNGQISLSTADLATSSADPWVDGMAVDARLPGMDLRLLFQAFRPTWIGQQQHPDPRIGSHGSSGRRAAVQPRHSVPILHQRVLRRRRRDGVRRRHTEHADV